VVRLLSKKTACKQLKNINWLKGNELVIAKVRLCYQRGVTLIELAIAMALFAIIAAMAAPYTVSWIDSGRVQNAGDLLDQAYRQAEALALRNPNAVIGTNPAAGIRLQNGILLVCAGDPSNVACTDGGANTVWRSDLPAGVAITVNGAALTVLGIDSFGNPRTALGALINGNSYVITRGSQNDNNNLF
jgi:prepilin-type N-terminal cleavage/methylation domain-containing protein